ncbi:hypothetical protein QR680_012181 [Steinernema hermaphroditum]|uniref:RING-type E3 ubiquitin transferase n=1 Tax=Steinernema hermaphroditum TaxID=289476 RepID=A0AA39I168_9BILA|nr:hypothetical protein QR680_012181 [Steinernema hermaphroditum]
MDSSGFPSRSTSSGSAAATNPSKTPSTKLSADAAVFVPSWLARPAAADKTCGICMENVWGKNARFGILQNCRHCFCLQCIRTWRQSSEMESKTIRSCPECRIHSHFVIPTAMWVDEGPEKDKLIKAYLENMSKKICKYFKPSDRDSCKFGNKCFYRHQNADGSLVESDSPNDISRRIRQNLPHMSDYFLDAHMDESWEEYLGPDLLALALDRQPGWGY